MVALALFGAGVVGSRRFSRTQEPIATPGDGHNPAFAFTVVLERFAQRRAVHLDVVFVGCFPPKLGQRNAEIFAEKD
jgi:hypothetical protein